MSRAFHPIVRDEAAFAAAMQAARDDTIALIEYRAMCHAIGALPCYGDHPGNCGCRV